MAEVLNTGEENLDPRQEIEVTTNDEQVTSRCSLYFQVFVRSVYRANEGKRNTGFYSILMRTF